MRLSIITGRMVISRVLICRNEWQPSHMRNALPAICATGRAFAAFHPTFSRTRTADQESDHTGGIK